MQKKLTAGLMAVLMVLLTVASVFVPTISEEAAGTTHVVH